MKNNCILTIFFLLGFSVNASDYLTIDKQMREMNNAFRGITHKGVSEKIFHNLNDTINFLLTTQKIVDEYLRNKPALFRFIWFSKDNGKLEFPLVAFPSDLLDVMQGSATMIAVQGCLDRILLYKNSLFPGGTQNSFDYNSINIIKNYVCSFIEILEKAVSDLSWRDSVLQQHPHEDQEVVFLQNTVINFYPLLLNFLKELDESLFFFLLNVDKNNKFKRDPKFVNKLATNEKFDNKLINDFKNLIAQQLYFSMKQKLSNDDLIKKITEEPFYASLFDENFEAYNKNDLNKEFLKIEEFIKEWQHERINFKLEGKLFNNLDVVNIIKQEIRINDIKNLPALMKDIGSYIEMLSCLENTKENEVLIKKLAIPIKNIKNDLSKILSLREAKEEIKEEAKEEIKEEIKEEAKEEIKEEAKEEIKEENNDYTVFDYEYFQQEHAYHQQRKNQAHIQNIEVPAVLSDYEIELFNFIQNNIYNCKNKQTWNQLVKGLSDLGFKGKANTFGNGSTWVFSVNKKNKLFFKDQKYKNATFNVHKFSGNGAIHPQYLKFFQSGLANVFGLSKDYVESLQ